MISNCPYICDNKTNMGYCRTTVCINPIYSNIGSAQYGQGVQKRIITNADRIRAMTDEELAEYLYSVENAPEVFVLGLQDLWIEWLKEVVEE